MKGRTVGYVPEFSTGEAAIAVLLLLLILAVVWVARHLSALRMAAATFGQIPAERRAAAGRVTEILAILDGITGQDANETAGRLVVFERELAATTLMQRLQHVADALVIAQRNSATSDYSDSRAAFAREAQRLEAEYNRLAAIARELGAPDLIQV